ncbi:hypothetical protein PYW07_008581 [Mythimna separata]|uniref:Uncharacterized protein n=1 Tax=Mythimna separata TaxID=271217 RepID=A0AAD7YCY4_MYTSE|nr:hypothetical protein PYW07_008581 [Mythimna separata]
MFLLILLVSLSVQENAAQKDLSQLDIENYTSCEKFVENSTFDPKSVLDIDWQIFYFWNPNFEESYNIKFSIPSDVLVDRFRVELDKEIHPPVNWSNSELFLESTIDFSALLIKTNDSGIFKIVPTLAFEYRNTPIMSFALKVVEPGYLGVLNCRFRLCYALAPANKMPHYEKLTEEAQKLGFWNDFGRTHIATIPPLPQIPPEPYEMDDDNEDENLEIIHQHHDIKFL